jgi:hypothetical protein
METQISIYAFLIFLGFASAYPYFLLNEYCKPERISLIIGCVFSILVGYGM